MCEKYETQNLEKHVEVKSIQHFRINLNFLVGLQAFSIHPSVLWKEIGSTFHKYAVPAIEPAAFHITLMAASQAHIGHIYISSAEQAMKWLEFGLCSIT